MKKILITLTSTFVLTLLSTTNSQAQDIHFSMFDLMPVIYNPAENGLFNGDYRFSAIHRNQWKSVTTPFVTTAVAVDVKSPFKRIKQLNGGIQLVSDKAGDSEYKTFKLDVAASYSFTLPKDSVQQLQIGIQSGFTNRTINYDALLFNNQYNGYIVDPTSPNGEQFNRDSRIYSNVNLGAVYKRRLDKSKEITVGLALHNVTKSEQSLNSSTEKLDYRTLITGKLNYLLSPKFTLIPNILFSPQGKYKEFILGSLIKYNLKRTNNIEENIYLGVHARTKDAIMISVGMDIKKVHARINYDINYSNLTPASNKRGGIEIGAVYIIKKVPNIKYKRCPDYI